MMSFRTRRRTLSIVIVAAVVSVLALLAGAPGLRWRTQVFLLFVAGRIPDREQAIHRRRVRERSSGEA